MRPENEWFKPEKLKVYYFTYELVSLAVVAVVVGALAYSGILWEISEWVVLVVGASLLVAFGFMTWWIPAFFRTADYRFTDQEIEFRRGVFFQQKTTVPYNRVTNVDATQGPIQRLVDAGQVGIHTAGYGGQMGAELTIDGVSDYEAIKDQILAKTRRRPPEATESGETDAPGRENSTPRSEPTAETPEVLAELRRIRELLEQGRTV
ncbi:PH domain-containing protein [Halorussus halophilus]|uniref:PH domain-containing protein n=1 Tax=Halorussus halophilus TaxID=2650975 RepID=UPI001300EF49|nr:PH domain-containing protein [Halorussus halophilus]